MHARLPAEVTREPVGLWRRSATKRKRRWCRKPANFPSPNSDNPRPRPWCMRRKTPGWSWHQAGARVQVAWTAASDQPVAVSRRRHGGPALRLAARLLRPARAGVL